MKPGLLTFDGYPSPKALAPEESKELLTAVVAPSPAHSHGFLNSGLSSSLSGPIFTCLSLGTVLHVIGITTTAWSSKWRYREGLWESCTCDSQKEGADWFRATQVLVIMGLVGIAISLFIAMAYIWVPRFNKTLTLYLLTAVCFLSGFFLFIGLAVFGSHRDHLNRSYVMTSLACVLCVGASFLALYQLKRAKLRE